MPSVVSFVGDDLEGLCATAGNLVNDAKLTIKLDFTIIFTEHQVD